MNEFKSITYAFYDNKTEEEILRTLNETYDIQDILDVFNSYPIPVKNIVVKRF